MHQECVCTAHVWKLSGDRVVASGRQNKEPTRRMVCFTETIFQVIHCFYKEKKSSKLRVYDSEATNRECSHIYNIAMEIIYCY